MDTCCGCWVGRHRGGLAVTRPAAAPRYCRSEEFARLRVTAPVLVRQWAGAWQQQQQ